MTAAAATGPARGPRPASSTPATMRFEKRLTGLRAIILTIRRCAPESAALAIDKSAEKRLAQWTASNDTLLSFMVSHAGRSHERGAPCRWAQRHGGANGTRRRGPAPPETYKETHPQEAALSAPYDNASLENGAAMRDTIFDELVSGENDVIGLLAYSLSMQNKRDWLAAFQAEAGRAPTAAEMTAYDIGEKIERRLATYRKLAEHALSGNSFWASASLTPVSELPDGYGAASSSFCRALAWSPNPSLRAHLPRPGGAASPLADRRRQADHWPAACSSFSWLPPMRRATGWASDDRTIRGAVIRPGVCPVRHRG